MAEETDKIVANDASAEPQPGSPNAAEVKSVVGQPHDATGWIWRKRWWHNSLLSAVYFAPKCFLPAGLWILAGAVMVLGSWQSSTRVGGGVVSGEALLTAMCILLCTFVFTLVLMLVSLGLWLICGIAYVRSYMQLDIDTDQRLDRQTAIALQNSAMEEVSHRKVYLAQFWVYVTLFLLLPLVLMMVGGVIAYLESVPAGSVVSIKLPAWLDMTTMAVMALATILFSQLSLVGMAVCAITTQEPFPAAKHTVKLFGRWFVPGFLLTILILAINIVIATPQVIWQVVHHENLFVIKGEVGPMLVENVWQGITSIILWTFTCTPICQMLRGQIE